jgi:hypothetical protein
VLACLVLGCAQPRPAPAPRAVRLADAPLIAPGQAGLAAEDEGNIDGPSVIRAPRWVKQPLGAYYLYFASHHGKGIRLAWAEGLAGPWRIHPRSVLALEATAARGHIASPDVIVDEGRHEVRMYFHGPLRADPGKQATFAASSPDGLSFTASPRPIAPPYLRVFPHRGCEYGIARGPTRGGGAVLVRSCDGKPFVAGPALLPRMRHAAVVRRGERLWVVYSRIGDAPERLLLSTLTLRGEWGRWIATSPVELLRPERPWEGASLPVEPSTEGAAREPRHELRDPALLADGGRLYLFYSVAGERGIAGAELLPPR